MSNQTKSAPNAATSKPATSSSSTAGTTKSKGVNTNQLVETVQVCITNLVSTTKNVLLTIYS